MLGVGSDSGDEGSTSKGIDVARERGGEKKGRRHPSPGHKRGGGGGGSPGRGSGRKDKVRDRDREREKEMRKLGVSDDYKPLPGRSKAPGFFGNESQASGTALGFAWNDNVDVDYRSQDSLLKRAGAGAEGGHLMGQDQGSRRVLCFLSTHRTMASSMGDRSGALVLVLMRRRDRHWGMGPHPTSHPRRSTELRPQRNAPAKPSSEPERWSAPSPASVTQTHQRGGRPLPVPFAAPLVTVKMKMDAEKLD